MVVTVTTLAAALRVSAADGTWSVDANGNWSIATNWSGSNVASGTDSTADFSTLDITAARTVTLDAAQTIGNLKFGDTGATLYGWTLGGSNALTLSATSGSSINVASSCTATISAVLAGGSSGLTKTGAGTLVLSGNNTFTDNLNIAQGTLSVASLAQTGAQPLGGDGSSITLSGGTLTYTGAFAKTTKNVTLAANTTSTINASNTTVTGGINNVGGLTGSGNLIVNQARGDSRTIFQGTNNFTGNVTLNGGILQMAYHGADASLGNNVAWTINGGGVRAGLAADAMDYTINVGSLSGAGYLESTDSASLAKTTTFSIGGLGTSTSYAGVIRNNDGNGSRITALAKVGAGTLTLSGTSTYTGGTTVSDGTLLVNGSLANTTTAVNAGTLGGSGTIGGAVTIASLATLAPGSNGTVSTLTLGNSLTLNSGALLAFDLAGVNASDKVSMTANTLSINGQQFADFTFNALSGFNEGVYTLIDAGTISGTGLGSNRTGLINGLGATLSVSGNDLILTVIPEPGTVALLFSALLGMIAYAWRKRK